MGAQQKALLLLFALALSLSHLARARSKPLNVNRERAKEREELLRGERRKKEKRNNKTHSRFWLICGH